MPLAPWPGASAQAHLSSVGSIPGKAVKRAVGTAGAVTLPKSTVAKAPDFNGGSADL